MTDWRRSTWCSADSPQCVEVQHVATVNDESGAIVRFRDSKSHGCEVLSFPAGSLVRLVNAL